MYIPRNRRTLLDIRGVYEITNRSEAQYVITRCLHDLIARMGLSDESIFGCIAILESLKTQVFSGGSINSHTAKKCAEVLSCFKNVHEKMAIIKLVEVAFTNTVVLNWIHSNRNEHGCISSYDYESVNNDPRVERPRDTRIDL